MCAQSFGLRSVKPHVESHTHTHTHSVIHACASGSSCHTYEQENISSHKNRLSTLWIGRKRLRGHTQTYECGVLPKLLVGEHTHDPEYTRAFDKSVTFGCENKRLLVSTTRHTHKCGRKFSYNTHRVRWTSQFHVTSLTTLLFRCARHVHVKKDSRKGVKGFWAGQFHATSMNRLLISFMPLQ